MCDDIALIDKSKKILDGKLSDIKQQFKPNQFEIGLLCDNKRALLNQIQSHFNLVDNKEAVFNADLRLLATLKSGETSTELIQFLNNKAQIIHFKEVIPSANDIFIKAVENNG